MKTSLRTNPIRGLSGRVRPCRAPRLGARRRRARDWPGMGVSVDWSSGPELVARCSAATTARLVQRPTCVGVAPRGVVRVLWRRWVGLAILRPTRAGHAGGGGPGAPDVPATVVGDFNRGLDDLPDPGRHPAGGRPPQAHRLGGVAPGGPEDLCPGEDCLGYGAPCACTPLGRGGRAGVRTPPPPARRRLLLPCWFRAGVGGTGRCRRLPGVGRRGHGSGLGDGLGWVEWFGAGARGPARRALRVRATVARTPYSTTSFSASTALPLAGRPRRRRRSRLRPRR